MNSFPTISRNKLLETFDAIVGLYNSDKIKIIDSADLALASIPNPFSKNTGPIAPQITTIRHKVRQIGGNYGRTVLILLIEAMYTDLIANGAIGVNNIDFCNAISISLKDNIKLKFSQQAHWNLVWELPIPQGEEIISIPLRKSGITQSDIIPDYIVQYVNQSINAYTNKNYLTALSLISIALEGTLRDALDTKGYTYTHGAQTVDSYEIKNATISANQSGYNILFQDVMPRHHNDFLSEQNQTPPLQVRIKRVRKNNRWILEIRDSDYLKDFWSSDVISQTGQINISGLGTALRVARDINEANILDVNILPTDIDDVIQQVRNNLIHLSGNAMTNMISTINMSLADFASDQARVFDTIASICDAIDLLYSKIADGSI